MTAAEIPSIEQHARPIAAGAPVVGAHFLGATAVFVLGDEALLFVAPDAEPARLAVHAGAILASACDGGARAHCRRRRQDRRHRVRPCGSDVIASDPKGRWIDHLALGPDGALAWSAGKEAHVRTGKGAERMLDAASTVGGLAFAPKGLRLAIAHYHGVTLVVSQCDRNSARSLEWKGSHLLVTFSPDNRFVVTAMQEPALHGWRLADGNNMRMSGYPAKVRSMSWSADGKALATSGANELIVWPSRARMARWARTRACSPSHAHRVAVVACHPRQDLAAVGYEDGLVVLVRLATAPGSWCGARKVCRSRHLAGPARAACWPSAPKMVPPAFCTCRRDLGRRVKCDDRRTRNPRWIGVNRRIKAERRERTNPLPVRERVAAEGRPGERLGPASTPPWHFTNAVVTGGAAFNAMIGAPESALDRREPSHQGGEARENKPSPPAGEGGR